LAFTVASAIGSPKLQLRILCEELLPRYPLIEVLAPPRRTYSNFCDGAGRLDSFRGE